MGLLNKLWDDTVGGPLPDKGVGKLRKVDLPSSPRCSSREEFSSGDSPSSDFDEFEALRRNMLDRRRSADFWRGQEEAKNVTQSIAIIKRPHLRSFDRSSSLPTGWGASPPVSPATKERERVWRTMFHPGGSKTETDPLESPKFGNIAEQAPTVYDWYNRLD